MSGGLFLDEKGLTKPKNRTNSTKEFSKQFEGATRSLPSKTRGLRQITPESSPEQLANSLSQNFFVIPFCPQLATMTNKLSAPKSQLADVGAGHRSSPEESFGPEHSATNCSCRLWTSRSGFAAICDCDAHRGPQKSLAISETRQSNAALHFNCARETRWRFAISGCDFRARNYSFLLDFWRFGSVNAEKSLAIAIVRFWRAKDKHN